MLRSKAFVKKTRKGGVVKVNREHYLRTDVHCGSETCQQCEQTEKPLQKEPQLHSSAADYDHYILPDTNVVLHQIDLLEHPAVTNLILLQTVLDEVKNRNSATYSRARGIIQQSDKHAYAFTNEHHRDTFIERNPQESANDRNDRAIRVATQWYNDHLADYGLKVVLLTNDAENRRLAREAGLPAFTCEEYIEGVEEHPELAEILAAPTDDSKDSSILYPEYLPSSTLQAGIKEGKFHQGSFQRSRENFLEGYVQTTLYEEPVLLKGRMACNRSVQGDVVAIRILPENEWSHPSKHLAEDEEAENGKDDDGEIQEDNSKSSEGLSSTVKPPPCGVVVGVIRRNWRAYCGALQASKRGGLSQLFVAADRNIPRIRIRTRQAASLAGKRLVVRIDGWERTSMFPHGHFVKELGVIGDKETENEVLLLEHDVPFHSFSSNVLACLPKMPWGLTEEDIRKRKDLRGLDICSIDPPGCTDIDDALHLRDLPNGNFEVGVHIADVTHFVKPDTALDTEASDRCTTVYLTDKRIDMVPELLGSNLCSLRSNVDRLAFSVLWEMTSDCEVVDVVFTKSIIRSKASFTYEEAQLRIDDPSRTDPLTESVRRLNQLAKVLRARRAAAGALQLASPEVRFQMDTENEAHDPVDVEVKELRETNQLVEEFMLLANITVAKRIFEHFPETAVLRRHPHPPQAKFDNLVMWAKMIGVELDTSTSKALADSLDRAVIPDSPYFNTLLRILTTRCMMQAVYFCSGTLAENDFYHYGLATPIYTHFTSPIRRYADVMVHRMLAVAIGWEDAHTSLLDKSGVDKLSDQMNYRHRMAQFAGRASVELHTLLFFKNRVVDEEGYVIRVKDNALIVLVPKYGIESILYLASKESGKAGLTYDEEKQMVTIGSSGHKFRMFDKITVRISVDEEDQQHKKLLYQLVHPSIPGLSVPPQIASNDSAMTAKRANGEVNGMPSTKKVKN